MPQAFSSERRRAHVALASLQDAVVYDALTGAENTRASLPGRQFTGLMQWTKGPTYRLAALDESAVQPVYRCNDLLLETSRTMSQDAQMVRALDSVGARLVVAAGPYVHAVAADDSSRPLSPWWVGPLD